VKHDICLEGVRKTKTTLGQHSKYLTEELIQGGIDLVDRCAAGCEAHTNFADESASLMADNVRNEVVPIHRSQEILKMISLYT
jgi:hypothetical protein